MRPTNLLNKNVPEDDVFLQTNSENKFIGTLIWKFIDFISLGVFESKIPEDQKRPEDINKTSNSTPLEPPMSASVMIDEMSMKAEPAIVDSKMVNPKNNSTNKINALLQKADAAANKSNALKNEKNTKINLAKS
jgi:hypothetical protein